MGLWPFGRSREDVDVVSRIVDVRAQDGVAVRGKLTVRFTVMLAAEEAEETAELCSKFLRLMIDEVPTSAELLGQDAAIGAEITARVVPERPLVRALDLHGLHVVGDPGHLRSAPSEQAPQWLRNPPVGASGDAQPSSALRPESRRPAAQLPATMPAAASPPSSARVAAPSPQSPRISPASVRPPKISTRPPPRTPEITPASPMAAIRRSSRPAPAGDHGHLFRALPNDGGEAPAYPGALRAPSPGLPRVEISDSLPPPSIRSPHRKPSAPQLRAASVRLGLPVTASPYEVARRMTPLVRDTSSRILIAFLRAYDLTGVRHVSLDAADSDVLGTLVAPSDGAPGTYGASHGIEVARWREAIGEARMTRLARETNLVALFLTLSALDEVGVHRGLTVEVIEGLASAAFSEEELIADLARYTYALAPTPAEETSMQLIAILSVEAPAGIERALTPLFETVRDELAAAAMLAKDAMGAGVPPL